MPFQKRLHSLYQTAGRMAVLEIRALVVYTCHLLSLIRSSTQALTAVQPITAPWRGHRSSGEGIWHPLYVDLTTTCSHIPCPPSPSAFEEVAPLSSYDLDTSHQLVHMLSKQSWRASWPFAYLDHLINSLGTCCRLRWATCLYLEGLNELNDIRVIYFYQNLLRRTHCFSRLTRMCLMG